MKWISLTGLILITIIQIAAIVGLVVLTAIGQLTTLMCVVLIMNSLTFTCFGFIFTALVGFAAED